MFIEDEMLLEGKKTINPNTMKESFTHQKLVSAYRSLVTNLAYLFTYKNHKKI